MRDRGHNIPGVLRRDRITDHDSDGRSCGRGVPIGNGNENAVPVLGAHVGSPSMYVFWRHLSYCPNQSYESLCTASTT